MADEDQTQELRTFVPGVAFRHGKLYLFESSGVEVYRLWPEPRAWARSVEAPEWRGIRPVHFRLDALESRHRKMGERLRRQPLHSLPRRSVLEAAFDRQPDEREPSTEMQLPLPFSSLLPYRSDVGAEASDSDDPEAGDPEEAEDPPPCDQLARKALSLYRFGTH